MKHNVLCKGKKLKIYCNKLQKRVLQIPYHRLQESCTEKLYRATILKEGLKHVSLANLTATENNEYNTFTGAST
jgi:hypothetical protein